VLDKTKALEKQGRMGMFDTTKNSREIMEEFVKL